MENWVGRAARRMTTLLHLRNRERDMADEMQFHIEMEARDLELAGRAPAAAAREARLRFGAVEAHKEAGRDATGVRFLEDIAQDVRYAIRQAAHNPSFTIATVVTLGLSVGASTFMYSFVTMSPVPFPDAGRLVFVRQYSPKGCPSCQQVSSGNALTFATRSRALSSIAFVQGPSGLALRGNDRSEVIRATAVTYQFFNTIGARTMLGTVFLPSDTARDAVPVALLSESAWRVRFGSDPSIVGRDIVLDGKHHVVRGVIGRDDVYPERTEVWTVLRLEAAELNDHASNLNYLTIGRLADGASLEQANAEAATVGSQLARDYPADFRDWQLEVRPLEKYGRGAEEDKKLFSVASAFVLAIACINLAGLLIARLTRRRRELAVRAAMGAATTRLTRQLLTETVVVCLAAGALGVGAAYGGLRALIGYVPESLQPPGFTRLGIDRGACLFAVGLASACGLVIALWPSLRFARPSLNDELRDGVRSHASRGSSGGERLRRVLVVIELALSVVLLGAAGLLLRSEQNIAKAPVGLSVDHVLTLGVQVPSEIDGKRVQSRGYFDQLADEIARVPGVTSAGAVAFLPLNNSGWSSAMFQVEGRPKLTNSGGTRTQVATPGYFTALEIPIVRGRALTNTDADTSRRVALVNETLARRFFPDGDVLGRVLVLPGGTRYTVVGVVADVKQRGVTADPGHEIIMPAATTSRRSMTIVVRTKGNPAELMSAVVKAIAAYDPNLAVNRIRTMSTVLDEFLAAARVGEAAMLVLAAIAIVIATMGLYAIMSFTVASRTREFGVRLAIGANPRSLVAVVLGQGLKLTAAGITLGVALALVVTRLMEARLFQVAPNDPLTFGAVIVGMMMVAVLAGLAPAYRVVSVDPVSSLRAE